jgi:hypothetical protein
MFDASHIMVVALLAIRPPTNQCQQAEQMLENAGALTAGCSSLATALAG